MEERYEHKKQSRIQEVVSQQSNVSLKMSRVM